MIAEAVLDDGGEGVDGDPTQGVEPVSAIAHRRMLPNATRFGQLVKQATGRTPVAYRRAALGPGAG